MSAIKLCIDLEWVLNARDCPTTDDRLEEKIMSAAKSNLSFRQTGGIFSCS